MHIILIILSILAGLILLVLVVAAIAPKSYSLERKIIINRPKADVFNYLKHLKNQDHYNKWVMRDPDMKKIYTGTDGTPGFIYGWDGGKQAGAGEQEIKNMVDGERLDLEIRFERPFRAVARAPFTTESAGKNKTAVTWGMSSRMPYPANAMLLLMGAEKMLGKDMDESLDKLKTILENR